MSNIQQITPFLHVPDLNKALRLLVEVLGFTLTYSESNYVYLTKQHIALRVLEERGRNAVQPEDARMTVYIDVEDVDALYAELLPALSTLPAGDVLPPKNQSWRQRELWVRLPDGHWLVFGQPVVMRKL